MNLLDCVGIDEVGRGCLAGPMIIAIASAKEQAYSDSRLNLLNDSKKLSEKKREQIASWLGECFSILLCEYSAQIIDSFGLSACYLHAQNEALRLYANSTIIIDGKVSHANIKAVINADALYPSVMAASIAAKVYRDNLMKAVNDEIYGFAKHKGYGVRAHINAIKERGLSHWHRKSFCKNFSSKMADESPEASAILQASTNSALINSRADNSPEASSLHAATTFTAVSPEASVEFAPKLIWLS